MGKTQSILCLCPKCQKLMQVVALGCDDCDLLLNGKFQTHPLMNLNEEMLHFLHVFIICEGKINDMEKALGISYPTVKNKLQKLKDSISVSSHFEKSEVEANLQLDSMSVIEILELINNRVLSYERGLFLIKQTMEKKK